MEFTLFIKEFYIYLIGFFFVLSVLSFVSYLDSQLRKVLDALSVVLAGFAVFYLGSRDFSIGTDTLQYLQTFKYYESLSEFSIRKDPFFDFLQYIVSHTSNYQVFLYLCAFVYVFGALYGLKKIFKRDYYLPFLLFLITPYFVAWGVNVMRSGMAASLFLVAIGYYIQEKKRWKIIGWILASVLCHISMLIPVFAFLLTRYFTKTNFIFILWIGGIMLSLLHINPIDSIISLLGEFGDRAGDYVVYSPDSSSWRNFLVFGLPPALFSVYNIMILKYENSFYKWVANTYLLVQIPFIILLDTEYAQRIGYLAGFMMPIILLFPLIYRPKLQLKYLRFTICILVFVVFLIKAYPILII